GVGVPTTREHRSCDRATHVPDEPVPVGRGRVRPISGWRDARGRDQRGWVHRSASLGCAHGQGKALEGSIRPAHWSYEPALAPEWTRSGLRSRFGTVAHRRLFARYSIGQDRTLDVQRDGRRRYQAVRRTRGDPLEELRQPIDFGLPLPPAGKIHW